MIKERDYSIDLIRIIATFMVVATHVKMGWIVDGLVSRSKLFYACLWADGVSLFFLITGFFLFNGRTYVNIIKKCIRTIILPVIIIVIISQILSPWIKDSNLFVFKLNLRIPFGDIVRAIGRQNAGEIEYCFHFWYIFTYIKVLLYYPLLKWICQNSKEQNRARWILIFLSIIYIVIETLKKFMPIEVNLYSLFEEAILLVVIGYEISIHKELIKKKSYIRYISGSSCVILILLRYYMQSELSKINIDDFSLINWNSIFGIVTASSFFIFVYSFDIANVSFKIKEFIKILSDNSFYIYLIHVMVYFKCESMGIRQGAIEYFDEGGIKLFLFNIVYPMEIIIISISIVLLVKIMVMFFNKKVLMRFKV